MLASKRQRLIAKPPINDSHLLINLAANGSCTVSDKVMRDVYGTGPRGMRYIPSI